MTVDIVFKIKVILDKQCKHHPWVLASSNGISALFLGLGT